MLKLTGLTKTRLAMLKRPASEDGVALIAVILVMMLLLMTTILISLTVMTTQNQTKEFNINQQARSTADTGLSSFLAAVNTSKGSAMLETYKTASTQGGVAQKTTPSNALCKTIDSSVNTQIGYYPRWCVWTVKVSSGTGSSGYYIYSKGFTIPTQGSTVRSNVKDEVVIRVFVEPVIVDSATELDNGKVVYRMPASAPFQMGLTGQTEFTVENGAKIYSNQFTRNSVPSGTNTKFVSIASDDLISLPSDFEAGTLVSPASKSVKEICTPAGNSACVDPVHRLSPVSTDMGSIATAVNADCPNAANSYPNWTASEETGLIPAGCYNNVVFDRDMPMTAAYSADMPLKVNVKGTLTVKTNVDIAKNSDPAAFQIRSSGSVVWNNASGASVSLGTAKHMSAYIASSAACTTSSNTTRTLYLNGALACGTVTIGKNTVVYMDTKSQQYGIEVISAAPVNSIWFSTGIEQL